MPSKKPTNGNEIPNCAARALSYVPLYDMLFEITVAIKDDPEASSEMRKLAHRAASVLKHVKAAVHPRPRHTDKTKPRA